MALEQVAALDAKAAALQAMGRALRHLAGACHHGDHRPGCPILDDLSEPPEVRAADAPRAAGALASRRGRRGDAPLRGPADQRARREARGPRTG